MYSKIDSEKTKINECIKFMSNTIEFSKSMEFVVYNWVNTMDNSLSNGSINKIAFIGQCAAFNSIGCPEYLTRKAWKHLDNHKQILANLEAEKHLKKWKLIKYSNTLKSGKEGATKKDCQMKLQMN